MEDATGVHVTKGFSSAVSNYSADFSRRHIVMYGVRISISRQKIVLLTEQQAKLSSIRSLLELSNVQLTVVFPLFYYSMYSWVLLDTVTAL
jgi:hypothetical protein